MSTEHDHRLREEFFERSVDLFCTATLEGRLLDFNPAWETLLGLGPSELRQANIRDLIHPEDYQETVDKILLMRGGQDAVVIEVRMVALDGSLHWVTWHAALASDRKSFQAIGREVTRHRVLYDVARAIPTLSTPEGMAERMLSETPLLAPAAWTSIALFGEAENEVVALEVVGLTGGPRTRMQMTFEAYGFDESLAAGRVELLENLSETEGLAPFLARHIEEGMRSSLTVPLHFGEEVLGCLHFGSEEPAAFSNQHVLDAQEAARQIALALKQIRLRQAVESSEASFRSIAANADGLVIVGMDGRVLYANPAAERLFDQRPGGMLDKPFGHEIEPGKRCEIPVISAQGPEGIAEIRTVRTEWAGEPALIASLRDVTEQRRLESNLLQAQKMAVVGRLAGAVAHDLNNLLTAMTGNVDLLRQGLGRHPEASGSIQAIAEAIDRATLVAQQVLAFSRKQVVAPRPMDLNLRIHKVLPLLRQACGEDVELSLAFDEGIPSVYADPIQIEQVLMNLVVNARDAVGLGGRVAVSTSRRDVVAEASDDIAEGVTPGTWVVLGVRDTGEGMGSETLEQIFEPFFTTKEAGKGLGLGLSTVSDIVHKSGGQLSVRTVPGDGTLFQIWLPGCEAPPELEELSQPVEALEGGDETILVVDDEPALRRLLSDCLQKAGYRVAVAADAHEALEIAARLDQLDLLLTDVRMPGTHGKDLEGLLRNDRPGLITIFMSGYSEEILAPSGVLESGVEFIAKPFRLAALLRRVRTVLDRS